MGLCKCELSRKVEQIGSWYACPLEGFAHTQFFVQRCLDCGGILGFPQSNFELALKDGTDATKKTLAEVVENENRVGWKRCQSTECENFTENEIEFKGAILVFCDECLKRMNINIINNIAGFSLGILEKETAEVKYGTESESTEADEG